MAYSKNVTMTILLIPQLPEYTSMSRKKCVHHLKEDGLNVTKNICCCLAIRQWMF